VEEYKRLNDIPCPKRSDITAICNWLNGMHKGAAFLAGDAEDVWNVQLVTNGNGPAGVEDFYGFEDNSGLAFRISILFASLQRLFCRGSNPEKPHLIDTSTSGALDQAISTIIASVLPVIPIVVFYFVQRLLVRIGLILVFTATFAAILVIGLQLKPDTTLAITTA
jgi:hypothetical protein